MESVIRALIIYLFLLIVLRISGKRTLSDVTVFDFVLILIIGEATQQALLGEDMSITNAIIVITTLLFAEIIMSLIVRHSPFFDTWINGSPNILVDHGKMLKERMARERVEDTDILEAARRLQGLERIDQIKFAVLEKSGGITIIPYSKKK